MKAIWKGSIAFGLVNIPVRLYTATETQGLASNMLYKKDHSRIRFQRVAESTGKEVPADEIVKGYEVEKNQFVILSDEELRDLAPEKSTGIEIQEFVHESEIPSLYFEKPYYLEPDKGAGKAYALLREALAKTGKVGIAQFVMRNKESLCVLKPQGSRPGAQRPALRFRDSTDRRTLSSLCGKALSKRGIPRHSVDRRNERNIRAGKIQGHLHRRGPKADRGQGKGPKDPSSGGQDPEEQRH